ncbi:Uncharacterised protein [uncultured archaeon]|nr:Uncharacterised protein [uncultured archaeon]
MKTWLKGCLIGLVIGLIILIVVYSSPFFNKSLNGSSKSFQLISKIILTPLDLLFPCSGESCLSRMLLIPLELIIVPILIGGLIGWLIGRFKK